MLKSAAISGACLLLLACSDNIEHAKTLVLSRLAETRGVEFQNLESLPGKVVCGEYRNSDPMLASSDFRRFIVRGDAVDTRPSDNDWAIFCSGDPDAALSSRLGIGPLDDPANPIRQIRNDLAQISVALEEYQADNLALPSTEQGLGALASATRIPPLPRQFKSGGYLATVPSDPWGRPYLYERSSLGGVAGTFKLYTLGADGTPGGTGNNADVSIEHLAYLDYIDP